MKKLLLILLCLPMIGFGQSWTFNSGGNDFDGKYKTSSVVGTGTDYPYDSPRLVINFFEDTEQINFYIADAGYFSSSSNTSVQLSFSNEKGTIYKSNSLSYSSDRKSVFLGDYFSPNNIKRFEIFQKLMAASYVNIRISNDYGKNDLKFSLKGSSRAIKFVIPYDEIVEEENNVKKNKELSQKKAKLLVQERDSVLRYNLKKYAISSNLENKIINNINLEIKSRGFKKIENIDSLVVWKSDENVLSFEIFYNYITGPYQNIREKSNRTLWYIVEVVNENIDSIPTFSELVKPEIKEEEITDLIKPKLRDYKSSNDYFKALKEYKKKKKNLNK